MAQLDCKVENCVYNKSDCCCKGDIVGSTQAVRTTHAVRVSRKNGETLSLVHWSIRAGQSVLTVKR